jgi:hypothetical protein
MTVDAIDGVHGRAQTQSPAEVWAAKLAEKLETMRAQVPSANTAPAVTTNAAYSPAVFAQAASFQVYTQAGTVAALSSGAGMAASSHVISEHPDDIKAVESVQGSTVSTLA